MSLSSASGSPASIASPRFSADAAADPVKDPGPLLLLPPGMNADAAAVPVNEPGPLLPLGTSSPRLFPPDEVDEDPGCCDVSAGV